MYVDSKNKLPSFTRISVMLINGQISYSKRFHLLNFPKFINNIHVYKCTTEQFVGYYRVTNVKVIRIENK